jgi:hypothetical protein
VPVILLDLSAERTRLPGLDLSLAGFGDDEVQRLIRTLDARGKR